jgi:hypothetical protein
MPNVWFNYCAMKEHNCRVMQDSKRNYNQPLDGNEIVFMCSVNNDPVGGQVAQATAG